MKAVYTLVGLLLVVQFTNAHKPAPSTSNDSKAQSYRKIASTEVKCSENPNEGIGIDPDYVEKQINAAGTCYAAIHIAESCGAGSSLDTGSTSAAIAVCDKLTGKISKADANLKKQIISRCNSMCTQQQHGTECLSSQGFCRLNASRLIHDVNSYR